MIRLTWAECSLFYRALLQKRHMIWNAAMHIWWYVCICWSAWHQHIRIPNNQLYSHFPWWNQWGEQTGCECEQHRKWPYRKKRLNEWRADCWCMCVCLRVARTYTNSRHTHVHKRVCANQSRADCSWMSNQLGADCLCMRMCLRVYSPFPRLFVNVRVSACGTISWEQTLCECAQHTKWSYHRNFFFFSISKICGERTVFTIENGLTIKNKK